MVGADTAFIFVVDGERLETQSMLLACTVRHFHPEAALIAYLSASSAAALPDVVRGVFEACGVERRVLPDHGDTWKRPYPHGNKLFAIADARDVMFSVFLDTDIVACRAMDLASLPGAFEVSVVPEGVPSWGKSDDRWERAYAHYGLELPQEKVRLTRRKRLEFLPYFNAGFVAMRETDRVGSKSFGALWLETASHFDKTAPIGGKRPWLDQITLPITMKRFGFRHKVVATDNNFSISDRAPEPEADPVFIHYHRARFLTVWPQWQATRDIAFGVVDARQHADFTKALAGSGFLGD